MTVTLLTRRGDGPTHEITATALHLTRCGRRIARYIKTYEWEGDASEVTCSSCRSLAARGERRAWKSR